MNIKNPLDKDISLLFKGETYTLEAGKSGDFSDEVAAQWVNIYGFLSEDEAPSKEEDKPKKAVKKTAKKVADKKEDKEVEKE